MKFIPYPGDTDNTAPKEFLAVLEHLTPEERSKLAWPENTQIAKVIYALLTDPDITPDRIYQQINQVKTKDFRPHILMLLKGFVEKDKEYKISRSLFETLHFWAEAKMSPEIIIDVTARTLEDDLSWMALTHTQANHFKKLMSEQKDIISPIESVVLLNQVDEIIIIERICRHLALINHTLNNYAFASTQRYLLEGKDFLEKTSTLFKIPALENLVEKLNVWLTLQQRRSLTTKMADQWIHPGYYSPEYKKYEIYSTEILSVQKMCTHQFPRAFKEIVIS